MIGINLIPESVVLAKRRRRRLRLWSIVLLATMAVAALPVGVEITRQHQVLTLKGERRQVEVDIKSTRETLNRAGSEIRTLEAQMARSDALRTKRPWSRLLGMLSRNMPDEMWLLSVATDPAVPARGDRDLTPKKSSKNARGHEPTVVTLEAPRALALEGYAQEYRNLYEFMSRLKQANVFREVTLTRATDEPVFDANAVRFKILCRW